MSCDSMDSNSDCYAYSASRNPSDVHKNQNSELEVGQVRWFYRDACDKRWLPFNGCDSINLELSYRSLLACNMTNTLGSCGHFTNRTGECSSNPEVPVRGGLFVAKVVQRCCFPIYWSGDKCPILRGTWFRECYNDNLEPLDDESMVERLEVEYTTRHLKTCNSLKSLRKSFYSSGNLFSKSDSGSPFQSVASAPVFQCSDVGETIGESPTQTSESLCEDFPIESESHLNDSSNTPSVLKKEFPTKQFTSLIATLIGMERTNCIFIMNQLVCT
ncbi:unnamed protein product [Heterobilharzia americana]|nr:unnamed protein product [Heterobilharzia americana]